MDNRYLIPELQKIKDDFVQLRNSGELTPPSRKEILEDYFAEKKRMGSSHSDNLSLLLSKLGVHFRYIEIKVIAELEKLGVDLDSIKINKQKNSFTFFWKTHSEQKREKYRVRFIKADITNPNKYPETLNNLLNKGIDIYLQKAGTNIASMYDQFACKILGAIKPGGFFISDDWTQNDDGVKSKMRTYFSLDDKVNISKLHPFEGRCKG